MRLLPSLIGLVAAGCGPSVPVDATPVGTTGAAVTTTGAPPAPSTATSGLPPTTNPGSTMPGTVSTSGIVPSTSSSDGGESSTGSCDCQGTPIGVDEPGDQGYSGQDLVDGAVVEGGWVEWVAVADDPLATSTGSATGGVTATNEVGGCCGGFLCVPCPLGITVGGVVFEVSTDDGRLADSFVGELTVDYDEMTFRFTSEDVPIAALKGTAATEAFEDLGEAFPVNTVQLEIAWAPLPSPTNYTFRLWGHGDRDWIPLARGGT